MDTLPWYRQPWPWFLIALPVVAVLGCSATLLLALRSSDEVVAADYYRRGLAINVELARRERAAQLGLTLELAADGPHAGDRVTLRVIGRQPLPRDATLELRLVMPGRAQAERVLVLGRAPQTDDTTDALFVGTWREDAGAVRQWVAESANWRVDGDADWRGNGGGPLIAHATAR